MFNHTSQEELYNLSHHDDSQKNEEVGSSIEDSQVTEAGGETTNKISLPPLPFVRDHLTEKDQLRHFFEALEEHLEYLENLQGLIIDNRMLIESIQPFELIYLANSIKNSQKLVEFLFDLKEKSLLDELDSLRESMAEISN